MVRWGLWPAGPRGSAGEGKCVTVWGPGAGDGGGRELWQPVAAVVAWSGEPGGRVGAVVEWPSGSLEARVFEASGEICRAFGLGKEGWASHDSQTHPFPAYFRDIRENRVSKVYSRITHNLFGFSELLPVKMIGCVGFGTFGFGNG